MVETVLNGKKFTVDYDGRKFYIVSIKGTAEEMGYAYGRLMKDELKVMVKDFFGWAAGYISNNVTQLAQLPRWLRNEIGQSGVAVAKRMLDLNYIITKKYTPQRWDDEFKGVAAGSGISIKTWRRISLIPELLKASCSIGGWWGPATKSGQLIQLRSLDWEEHAPISKFPMITVYHPTEEGSVPFANIAWVGFFGSLTGYSSAKIGVSERLRGGPADSMTRFGKPWTYALRDVLQFSKTIDDALNNLNQTNRTCSVYLGIGSGHNNTYRIIEYSETDFRVYDDKTWHLDSNHPRTAGMFWKAYRDDKPCFRNHFEPNYGQITPELVYRYVAPRSETGDSQVIVMDHATNFIYAMYPNPKTSAPGFQRPAIKIDLNPRFNEDWL